MKNFFKLFIIVILITIISFLVLSLLNKKIMPIYFNYAKGEMERLVTTVITKSVNDDLTDKLEIDKLFIIKNEENSKMTMVDFDPVVLNRLMSSITDLVYENLKLVSEKDLKTLEKYNISSSIFYIPSGVIFNSPVLNNLGPKIPVNLELISVVNPNLETKVTDYGINNSLIEVFINIKVKVKMILPLASDSLEIVVILPISVKLIQGMVPDYYLGSLEKAAN